MLDALKSVIIFSKVFEVVHMILLFGDGQLSHDLIPFFSSGASDEQDDSLSKAGEICVVRDLFLVDNS
jgi:hypothetical protein